MSHALAQARRQVRRGGHVCAGLAGLLAAVGAVAAPAADAGWLGTWAAPRERGHASVSVTTSDAHHVTGTYDEAIGINGLFFEFDLPWVAAGVARGEVDMRGQRCVASLTRNEQGGHAELELDSPCIPHYGDSPSALRFLAPGTPDDFEAGFDCARASSAAERAICASAVLADADRDLAQRYRALGAQLAGDARARLVTMQRAWLQARDRDCVGAELERCLWRTYGSRLFQLQALDAHGLWFDGEPEAAAVIAVARRVRDGGESVAAVIDGGLDLWLASYGGHLLQSPLGALADDGDAVVTAGSVRLAYRYEPNSLRVHDPLGYARVVFIAFDLEHGTWLADRYFSAGLYGPRDHNATPPPGLVAWSRTVGLDLDDWTRHHVFPQP